MKKMSAKMDWDVREKLFTEIEEEVEWTDPLM